MSDKNNIISPFDTLTRWWEYATLAVERLIEKRAMRALNNNNSITRECFDTTGKTIGHSDVTIKILQPVAGSRFDGHFPGKPIVPWVALAQLACEHPAWGGTQNTVREFCSPIRPGDRIRFVVVGNDEEPELQVENTETGEKMAQFTRKTKPLAVNIPLPESFLARAENGIKGTELIPHGDTFRFVDTTWTSVDKNPTLLEIPLIHWSYTIREKDTENWSVPFWLLEEAAAQMMLAWYRSEKWPKSEIMTYGKAETELIDYANIMNITAWTTIILNGHFIRKEGKRGLTGEYTLYKLIPNEWEMRALFSGQITGNLIPLRAWDKL